MKSVINVKCPECGGWLEIDTVSEKVLAHRRSVGADDPDKDKGAIFEEVVDRVKTKRREAEDKFRAAQRNVADSSKRIDELFGEVKKKIEEEKKKGPSADENDPRKLFWD